MATFSQELIRSLKISVFGLYSPYRIFWTGGHSVFSLFRPRDWAPAPPLPAGRRAPTDLWRWPGLPPPRPPAVLGPRPGRHQHHTVRQSGGDQEQLSHFLFQTSVRGPAEDHGEEGLRLLGVGHHLHPGVAPPALHQPLLQTEPTRWLWPPAGLRCSSLVRIVLQGRTLCWRRPPCFLLNNYSRDPKQGKLKCETKLSQILSKVPIFGFNIKVWGYIWAAIVWSQTLPVGLEKLRWSEMCSLSMFSSFISIKTRDTYFRILFVHFQYKSTVSIFYLNISILETSGYFDKAEIGVYRPDSSHYGT